MKIQTQYFNFRLPTETRDEISKLAGTLHQHDAQFVRNAVEKHIQEVRNNLDLVPA
jgi:predicted DNA-binding protein